MIFSFSRFYHFRLFARTLLSPICDDLDSASCFSYSKVKTTNLIMSGPPLRSYSNPLEPSAPVLPPVRAASEPATGRQPPANSFYPQLPLDERSTILDERFCDILARRAPHVYREISDSGSPVASGSGLSQPTAYNRASETPPRTMPPVLSPAAVKRLNLLDLQAVPYPGPGPLPPINSPHRQLSSDSDITLESWMWGPDVDSAVIRDWIRKHYPADKQPHIAKAGGSFKRFNSFFIVF